MSPYKSFTREEGEALLDLLTDEAAVLVLARITSESKSSKLLAKLRGIVRANTDYSKRRPR
jgi:hypothetical protein